jgi:hypothetical protein
MMIGMFADFVDLNGMLDVQALVVAIVDCPVELMKRMNLKMDRKKIMFEVQMV